MAAISAFPAYSVLTALNIFQSRCDLWGERVYIESISLTKIKPLLKMSRGWISFPADPQLQAEVNMKGCMQLQAVLGRRTVQASHDLSSKCSCGSSTGRREGSGQQAPDPWVNPCLESMVGIFIHAQQGYSLTAHYTCTMMIQSALDKWLLWVEMKYFILFPFFVVVLDSFVLMAQDFSQMPSRKPAFLQVQAIQQYNILCSYFAWKKAALKYME